MFQRTGLCWLTFSVIFFVILSACSLGTFLDPQIAFEKSHLVAAPDYTQTSAWAALPSQKDKADLVPPGLQDQQAQAQADVFFVHPTVWFSRTQWNADFLPGSSRQIVDEVSMATQASLFNECCRVYAPRYRQTTFGAFYADPEQAQQSFEIAYQDIASAFDHFLKTHNQGRPFILAGHSQGSMHLLRLLEKIDQDDRLRQRFVGAYLPGMAVPLSWYSSRFTNIKPCESPAQTGCVAAWDTYREGAAPKGHDSLYYWQGQQLVRVSLEQPRQCTHPITWRTNQAASERVKHLGAIDTINLGDSFTYTELMFSEQPLNPQIESLKAIRREWLTAQCDPQGSLRVPDLTELNYPAMETQPGNYHLLDYQLFWLDIRENTKQRLQAWQAISKPKL